MQATKNSKSRTKQDTGLIFAEASHLPEMKTEVTAGEEVDYQVQVFAVLERVPHVDEKRVVQVLQEVLLIQDGIDAAFLNDFRLGHLLQSIQLLVALHLAPPHSAKASLADHVKELKVLLSDWFFEN